MAERMEVNPGGIIPRWAIARMLNHSSSIPQLPKDYPGLKMAPLMREGFQFMCFRKAAGVDETIYITGDVNRNVVMTYNSENMVGGTKGVIVVSDRLKYAYFCAWMVRQLFADDLERVAYDDPSCALRGNRWRPIDTVQDILHMDPRLASPSEDTTVDDQEVTWWFVEGVTSLGTYDPDFPGAKSDILFVHSGYRIEFRKIPSTRPCANRFFPTIECALVLDNESNVIMAIFHNNANSESQMQVFDTDRFWILYEEVIASFIA